MLIKLTVRYVNIIKLSQRPLTGSDADRSLFVDRLPELSHLARAAQLGFNVLVLGERGIGTTSLMRQHQRYLQDDGCPNHYVRAAQAKKLGELLTVIRIAVKGRRAPTLIDPLHGLQTGGDPDPLREIRNLPTAVLEPGDHRPTIILDEMHKPELVHELFGRYRDDLWEMPFRWVVCGLATRHSDYLEPPADSFFDTTLTLGPLGNLSSTELLKSRLAQAGTNDSKACWRINSELSSIVERGGGNPRQLLAAARAAVLRSAEESLTASKLVAAAAELGTTEKLALEYLLMNGPTSASDPQLLEDWQVTRARANQVLRRLEDAGLVSAIQEKRGIGRPRKLYVTSLGNEGDA